MPTPKGETETGHSGDGYVKISFALSYDYQIKVSDNVKVDKEFDYKIKDYTGTLDSNDSSLVTFTVTDSDSIINVTGGPNISLYDANIALETITQEVGDDINTYLGIAINENLDDEIIVTVIATGFEEEKEEVTVQPSVAKPLGDEPQTYDSFDDDDDDDDGFPPAFIKNRRI